MGKLLIFLFLFYSCASGRKADKNSSLTVERKESLYSNQDKFEVYQSLQDSFFRKMKGSACSEDWEGTVNKLKTNLRKVKKINLKARSWKKLGDCYALIGEYKKTIFYYDLVLASGTKNTKLTSGVYYNLGQIYELSNQLQLAKSYYLEAKKLDDMKSYSLIKLALLEHKLGEFDLSNEYLKTAIKRYPKSDILRFLLGVNYFHLNKPFQIKSKVIQKLDEKSISRALLMLAMKKLKNTNGMEAIEAELSGIDSQLSLHNDFRRFLLSTLTKNES